MTFTIPGTPKGQARPKFARIGGFVRAYDPKESRDWKSKVGLFAQAAGIKPIEGPVSIIIYAYLPRPQRLCRKKDPVGPVPATCKPDFDNLAKGVCDGLNGIAYADDSAVVSAVVKKFYHAIGGVPETHVTIDAHP